MISLAIQRFVSRWDARLSGACRAELTRPLLVRAIGLACQPTLEKKRSWFVVDWYVREFLPEWLDMAELHVEATALRSLDALDGYQTVASVDASTVRDTVVDLIRLSDDLNDRRSVALAEALAALDGLVLLVGLSAEGKLVKMANLCATYGAPPSRESFAGSDEAMHEAWAPIRFGCRRIEASAVRLVERMIAAEVGRGHAPTDSEARIEIQRLAGLAGSAYARSHKNQSDMPLDELRTCVGVVGGTAAAARLLGVAGASVRRWLAGKPLIAQDKADLLRQFRKEYI